MKTHRPLMLLMLAAVLPLAACHRSATSSDTMASGDLGVPQQQPLPRPQADGRAVTGMPEGRPLPASSPDAIATMPATAATPAMPASPTTSPGADAISPAPIPATSPTSADPVAQGAVIGDSAEPTVDDAVRVIREYYDAINRGGYERAYGLWADRGGASGMSLQQFSDNYANVARDSVDIQRPSPSAVEGAAGSRYLEIPVRITSTSRDQRSSTYTGSYILRRSVVDGASAEQRKWRIQSARLVQGN